MQQGTTVNANALNNLESNPIKTIVCHKSSDVPQNNLENRAFRNRENLQHYKTADLASLCHFMRINGHCRALTPSCIILLSVRDQYS